MGEGMKVFRKGFGIGAVFLLFLAVFSIWYAWRDGRGTGLITGQEVPGFKLRGLLGRPGSSLEESRGKETVLVHFWASWCPPCLEELPGLIAFARKTPALRVLAVNLDRLEEDAKKVLPKGEIPPNFMMLWDPEAKVSEAYGSYQFPETFLVDRTLKLQAKWIGPQPWADESLRQLIVQLP